MWVLRKTWLLYVLVLSIVALAVTVSACGDDDDVDGGDDGGATSPASATTPPATTSPPEELTGISVTTDFNFIPPYAPLLLAEDLGYYAEEGLEADISQAGQEVSVLEALNRGQFDFVYGAADEVPYAIAEGIDVVVVAGITHGNPTGVIVSGDSDIMGIDDLGGKTIGVETGGGLHVEALPDILDSLGVDPNSIETVGLSSDVRVPSLLTGQVDAITGFGTGTYPQVQVEDPEARFYGFADVGFDYMGGYAIITNRDMIDNHPDVVRGFVRAVLRAWVAGVDDTEALIEAGESRYPETYLDRDLAVQRWEVNWPRMETPATEGNGLGYTADEEWQSLIDTAEEYGDLEPGLTPADLFTNEFLPDPPLQLN